MSELRDQSRFREVIETASEMLGCPARLAMLDWRMDRLVREAAVFQRRRGLAAQHAVESIDQSRRGHATFSGLVQYRVDIGDSSISVIRLQDGFAQLLTDPSLDLWLVPTDQYKAFYRFARELHRTEEHEDAPEPIMRREDRNRLWENSIGFLQRGDDVLTTYGVPQKRGVLLIGEPGNGKTMACRWLFAECSRRRINWRCVGVDQYDMARSHGATSNLFSIASPGVILFDDLDLGMRNRDESGPTREHSTLLAELDGVEQREGVVYLFTTNMKLEDLDPAFLRRGRIDQVIQFSKPNAVLRQEMVERFWHADIVAGVDVDEVVKVTSGRSFADLAELKKLLVLHYADTQQWNWEWAWKNFLLSEEPDRHHRRRIGFNNRRRRHDEDFDPIYDPMTAGDVPF